MTRMIRALLFLVTAPVVVAQVPLNTGYNHALNAPYAIGAQDQYWIALTSYPNSPTAPARTIAPNAGWTAPLLPQTRWISAWNTNLSQPGTSAQNPSYTIFRKCFCLMPNFKNPTMSFQLRADDNVQAWFNTVTQTLIPPQIGNWWTGSPVLQSPPVNPAWFRTGRNCLYVLLEDTGGAMGFDLAGSVQAVGLLPLPAHGVGQSIPCCDGQPAATVEADVLKAIRAVAEKRRQGRVQLQRR